MQLYKKTSRTETIPSDGCVISRRDEVSTRSWDDVQPQPTGLVN